jgi:hypothetical protein
MRVYELARRLGIDSAELIPTLRQAGVRVVSHASSIEQSTISHIVDTLTGEPWRASAATLFERAVHLYERDDDVLLRDITQTALNAIERAIKGYLQTRKAVTVPKRKSLKATVIEHGGLLPIRQDILTRLIERRGYCAMRNRATHDEIMPSRARVSQLIDDTATILNVLDAVGEEPRGPDASRRAEWLSPERE